MPFLILAPGNQHHLELPVCTALGTIPPDHALLLSLPPLPPTPPRPGAGSRRPRGRHATGHQRGRGLPRQRRARGI